MLEWIHHIITNKTTILWDSYAHMQAILYFGSIGFRANNRLAECGCCDSVVTMRKAFTTVSPFVGGTLFFYSEAL